MSKLFLPLQSNFGWFANDDTTARLDCQLKAVAMMYDRLHLGEGRFHITASADGQGMTTFLPPAQFTEEQRSRINYYVAGEAGSFSVEVGGVSLLFAVAAESYDADFYPILHKGGVQHEPFIEWCRYESDAGTKARIDKRVQDDLRSKHYDDVLPANPFIRKHLLTGYYRDSSLAQFLKLPFSVDFHLAPLIAKQRWSLNQMELPSFIYQNWINLDLPDFSQLPWQRICELRDSDAGKSFREMLSRLSTTVRDALKDIKTEGELQLLVSKEFTKEVLQELRARTATSGGTLVSILLNMIPFGSVASIGKDVATAETDRSSWIWLLQPNPKV